MFFIRKNKLEKLYLKIKSTYKKIYNKYFFRQKPGFYFFYKREKNPPIPNSILLKSINKQYDIVVILFWQGMLSFSSIKAIYEKIHCKFHFLGVDYSQMSGGCHFVGDCNGYKDGCRKCYAVEPFIFNNFAKDNVEYRKKIYEDIKPIVGGNSYMINEFYKKSYLLKNAHFALTDAIIDLEKFKPYDKNKTRKELNYPIDKSFFILFGAQNLSDKRKGIEYLIEALDIFYQKLSNEQREDICVISIGNTSSDITKAIKFKNINLGYVSENELVKIYASADVFLSSTINDAGPIMINQSQSCGTPVVSFEIGGALDCIKDKNLGYCAKLKDSIDFAKGIEYIYRLTELESEILRNKNREYAINHYSYKAAGERLYKLCNE